MATSRPFSRYSSSGTPSGTERYGDLLVGVDSSNPYDSNYSGVIWWQGPDEDIGYVIAQSIFPETQPTPIGNIGNVGFFRTSSKDDNEFVNLTKVVTSYQASSAIDAKNYLLSNGYWTSYTQIVGSVSPFMELLPENISYLWFDSSGNNYDADAFGVNLGYYNEYEIAKFTDDYIYYEQTFTSSPLPPPPPGGVVDTLFSFSEQLSGPFTYELWANNASTSDGTLIAEWGATRSDVINNGGWSGSQVAFVGGTINAGVRPNGYLQGPSFSAGIWYHIVTTYDSGNFKLYVDGVLYASQSAGPRTVQPDIYLSLGSSDSNEYFLGSTGSYGRFFGRIGLWRIYQSALDSSTILANFNTEKVKFDNTLVLSLDAGNLSSYGSVPFSNTYGQTWYDISFKGNHGTITGATWSTLSGVTTFYFDGSGDYVLVDQPIPSSSNYSIIAWVNANSVTGSRNIVSSQDSPFWISNGTLYAGVGGNYTEVSSSSFPLNTWKHVAVTFNDTTNTMTLYINGVQVDQNTSVTVGYTSQNTYIGSHYFGGNPVSFWDGYIAQVNIYTTEQTSTQILNNFNNSKSKYGL